MKLLALFLFFTITNADLLQEQRRKGATLVGRNRGQCLYGKNPVAFPINKKPLSACCDIPELGDQKPLSECSNPKLPGPCNDIQCVFEKSGFLTNKNTLNKEAYRAHLKKWAEGHSGWSEAVDRAIADCVDKELRQYLEYPCKAYDVFTCTGIAMLKKCPKASWIC